MDTIHSELEQACPPDPPLSCPAAAGVRHLGVSWCALTGDGVNTLQIIEDPVTLQGGGAAYLAPPVPYLVSPGRVVFRDGLDGLLRRELFIGFRVGIEPNDKSLCCSPLTTHTPSDIAHAKSYG
jgi:hypothetical protein